LARKKVTPERGKAEGKQKALGKRQKAVSFVWVRFIFVSFSGPGFQSDTEPLNHTKRQITKKHEGSDEVQYVIALERLG
jgi:hypothetical protein